jgi:hypothetical protein
MNISLSSRANQLKMQTVVTVFLVHIYHFDCSWFDVLSLHDSYPGWKQNEASPSSLQPYPITRYHNQLCPVTTALYNQL